MRNPNGYGTVVKLSGKRRNPFLPRKVIGFLESSSPIFLPGLPAFQKQDEADIFLATYNKDVKQEDTGMHIKKDDLPRAIDKFKELESKEIPFRISPFLPKNLVDTIKPTLASASTTNFNTIENCANEVLEDNNIDINANNMSDYTVEQVYEAWGKEVFPTKEEIEIARETKIKTKGKLSAGNMKSLKSAYNYLKPIYKIKYKNVTSDNLQKIIDDCDKSDSVLSSIINLMKKLDKFAARKEIITIKRSDDVTVEYSKDREPKIPFTNEQVHKFWTKDGLLWADITLFLLYSGMRIEESFDIRTADVYVDDNYLLGGIKTQAGINRIIPLHPAIKHIIERYYNPNNKYLFMFEGKRINKATFYKYYYLLLDELGIPHIVPHTTRVTFRTALGNLITKEYQKTCLDKIMGHITNDTGKDIYDKKDLIKLLEVISLLKYDINEKQVYVAIASSRNKNITKSTSTSKATTDATHIAAMNEFEASIKATRTYQRFLNKINRNYEKAKTFSELTLVETIAEYNEYLSTLSPDSEYFFKCRDAIDNLYRYYYKHFILKSIKNKSTKEIITTLNNNIQWAYDYNQVRKTLILIFYYDTLINYYTNQFSEDEKTQVVIGLNKIIEHFTNFYKRNVVTKYKCSISILLNDNYDMQLLSDEYEFKIDNGFYKSPDNSFWINIKTRKIENMTILSQNGLYDTWIKKFKENNIIHYAVS